MFFSIYLCAVYVRLLNSNAQLDSDLKREKRRRKGFVYQQRIIRTDYLLLLLHLANSSSPGRGERKKENKRRNESDGVVRVSSVLRATIFLQFVWCSRRVFLLSNLLGLCVCVCSSSELGSPGSHKPLAPPPCLPVCLYFLFVVPHTHRQTQGKEQQMTENGRLAQTCDLLQRWRRPNRRAGQRLERQWRCQNGGGSFGLVQWQNARHAPRHLRPYRGSTDSLPADRRAIRPHSGASATSRHLLVVSAQRTRHLHVFLPLQAVDQLFGISKSAISSRIETL